MTMVKPESFSDRRVLNFSIIWLGQFVSMLGSGLTSFAIGIWVYQQTESVTQFSLIFLSTSVPGLLIAPLAGALVDRWDRRQLMIFSDAGSAFCTLVIAGLVWAGDLRVWTVCLALAVSAALSVFHSLAYATITTVLIPPHQLARANGIIQAGPAAAQILSPLLASVLLAVISIQGVLLIDFATFLCAVIALMLARVPAPEAGGGDRPERESLFRDATYGWKFILARPGLFGLLIFFAAMNFAVGLSLVLLTPLLLSFATVKTVGITASLGSAGLLMGSLLMGAWGGPKRRIYGILVCGLLMGLCFVLAGARQSFVLIALANFGILFLMPLVNSCSQAIWQSKTPLAVQGRVFAVRMIFALSTAPIAYALAGPLTEKVFEPLLNAGGPFAESLRGMIGAGAGRGIGLMFVATGVMMILVTGIGFLVPRLRSVEEDLPDAAVDAGLAGDNVVSTTFEPVVPDA